MLKDNKNEAGNVLSHLKLISRNDVNNYVEYAFDYAHAGLYYEATELLSIYKTGDDKNTLVEYYLGWFVAQSGKLQKASEHFKQASLLPPHFVFTNRIEDIAVFQKQLRLIQMMQKHCIISAIYGTIKDNTKKQLIAGKNP